MLSEDVKKKLLELVENQDVNISELKSAKWIRNIYGVEPHLAVDGWDYDSGEYFSKQAEQLADSIDNYGVCNYLDIPEELWDDESFHKEVVDYLRGL